MDHGEMDAGMIGAAFGIYQIEDVRGHPLLKMNVLIGEKIGYISIFYFRSNVLSIQVVPLMVQNLMVHVCWVAI
jgi:hypothetical protein